MKLFCFASIVTLLLLGCSEDGTQASNVQPDPEILFEPDEVLAGGRATANANTIHAYSQPLSGLTGEQTTSFVVGNSLFKKNWVKAPATATARDGLGPTFNEKSCSACHFLDGRDTPRMRNSTLLSPVLRISITGTTDEGFPRPDPNYGDQFQVQAIQEILPEVEAHFEYTEIEGQYSDGESYSLREPKYIIDKTNYGPLANNIMVSPRIGPFVMGLGLLEAVPEDEILSMEDPSDTDKDGISGKANWVWDRNSQKIKIGRFGWKANTASLEDQTANAFFKDVGLTSRIHPKQNCPENQTACQDRPHGGIPELEDEALKNVIFYLRTLAVPARRKADNIIVLQGKQLFHKGKCASCHKPSMNTGNVTDIPQLTKQKIYAYTDLLLHDMGAGLADNRPDFRASGREWRTPPLWGIGLLETVNDHNYLLHDGRARNFAEAILWHGGEATDSRQFFKALPKIEREALITFLKSL